MSFLGDFNVHHKDWLMYSGGTDRSGELCYNFSTSNYLTKMVNFPTRIPGCDSHSPALVFVLQWLSFHWKILIMLLSQFPLTFHHIHYGMPRFSALLMTILVLIRTVFVIIWEMLHGRISLNSLPPLLLLWIGSGWNWCIYPSSKVSGQASLISMDFSCLHYCQKSLFSFVPRG